MPATSQATRYPVLRDYGPAPGQLPEAGHVSLQPYWVLTVIRLGKPLSYSRAQRKAVGKVVEGAFTRAEAPLVITDDCLQLQIHGTKASHLLQLQAVLTHTTTNYLDSNVLLAGDWLLAHIVHGREAYEELLGNIQQGFAINRPEDGLRFLGRVHSIRRTVAVDRATGRPAVTYQLQGIGFEELDTQFYYDFALATSAAAKNDWTQFMAQLGLDYTRWASKTLHGAGDLTDNGDALITALINAVVGAGGDPNVNTPTDNLAAATPRIDNLGHSVDTGDLQISPQANREAPAAYLVPIAVGNRLGLTATQASKSGVYGYADLLETIIGAQSYTVATDPTDPAGFTPDLDATRTVGNRKICANVLRGSFLPIDPTFTNKPLWTLLQQYLNPAINEMFTALRLNERGLVVPTIVARQIPFSTEAADETSDLPLTRFLNLPRWVIDPVLIHTLDVGRSNATRCNLVHVYGEAAAFAANRSITNQLVRNPPVLDLVDIQRSGIRARMQTVNCALNDQLTAPRAWMEAIADWAFGSQYTLNGTVECLGIPAPIVHGDNAEIDGLVYHLESVTHRCGIAPDGTKDWTTTLELSNGMPADQTEATDDFPRYPGFHLDGATTTQPAGTLPTDAADFGDETGGIDGERSVRSTLGVRGDPDIAAGLDPGTSLDTDTPTGLNEG